MPAATIFAAAWVAGIVEGISVLSNAQINSKDEKVPIGPRLIIPSVLYGTLSLPLGLIGASPGPTMIGYLPFAPKMDDLKEPRHPTSVPTLASVPTSLPGVDTVKVETPGFQKSRGRADVLREENRRLLSATRPMAPLPPRPALRTVTSPPSRTRYLATLDGQALLPTPMAEAMRRTRFLLIGSGLVTLILSFQSKREHEKRQMEEETRDRKRNGKDLAAVQELISNSKQGAVVRWCDSAQQVADSRKTKLATIPLFANASHVALDGAYWNPGRQPDEWSSIPISSDWLMRTKTSRLLVLEADITACSMDQYFGGHAPNASRLSEAVLMLEALTATATKQGVLSSSSEAVKVVLGSNQPTLPLSSQDIYLDTLHGLGVQVNSVLERMHREIEADLAATRKGRHGDTDSLETPQPPDSNQPISTATVTSHPRETNTASEHLRAVVDGSFMLVDTIGSSIRQAVSWALLYLKEIHDDKFRSHRIVHVLSDQRAFVHFLQQSLRDWKIVWYDANQASDVELYRKTDTAISVVCCGSDVATSAFLAATTTANKAKILAVFEQPTSMVPPGVSIISIQEVHNALFSHVRDMLADDKTPEEIRELTRLICR